ncbi:MAG: endo-1,4-beta-xylanase [Candidatus Thiodiazotropha sp.]
MKFIFGLVRIQASAVVAVVMLLSGMGLPLSTFAENPIVSHVYTADPAARVFNDRVYVIMTHDQDDQHDYGKLVDYYLFSSDDMVNWQDHGIIWNSKTNTSWANLAYAPDFIERNGKYYLYFPDGAGSIGVAVADKPEGPYKDPLGHPLVDRGTPNANVAWLFDPGVFIDDDGQAYLYFGGGGPGNARVIRLNSDMISTSGSAITIDVPNFFEALYMHKHNGMYYLSYSSNPEAGMNINYMTSNNPTSGFTFRGTILANPWENNSNNNHASIIEYDNQPYIFYHNRVIANQRGASIYQRSANVDKLFYNGDGSIKQVSAGPAGAPQIKQVDAFAINEAEKFDVENGIETEKSSEGTMNLMMEYGDWIKISQVNFGAGGAEGIKVRIAANGNSALEIILDDINMAPLSTLQIDNTGGWQTWQTQSAAFSNVKGVHDVYLRSGGSHNLNWYQFIRTDAANGNDQVPGDQVPGDPVPGDQVPGQALNNGRYNIVSSVSGMYLDVYGKSSNDGANIIQYRNTGGLNQQFDVEALGDGTYSIRPAHSGKSLDVYEWNQNDGAELRQWTYTGASNQRWHIDDAGDGLYSITSAFSNKALDVWGMSKAAGADVKLYSWWSGPNQLWSFIPAGSTPNSAPNTAPSPGGTNHGRFVGNITTAGRVRSDFIQYWDQITPENEGKWGSVEYTRDGYNWSGLDAAYNYAKQHNIPFKEHTLVWGNQYPQWMDSLSPSEQAAEIEEWIRDFCHRYPDVNMIDVVNEATPGHAPANYARRAFGDNWIIRSFQLARQYCPKATLILNDYNVLSWNTDEFIAMATPVVRAGVVDGLGLQAHGLADWSTSDIEHKLNQVAQLGLPLYISEYDIQKTNDQDQLRVMQSQFPLFYNHPSVAGITLWGYVVGNTWQNGTGLIYNDGRPRPAMTWLMNYLKR